MKKTSHRVIAYERPGPVSDMFVPQRISISSIAMPARRAPRFVSALLLLVAAPALLYQGSTLSYFSDREASTGNTFAAGPLDFTVTPDHTSAILNLGQLGETFVLTVAPVTGSLPFRYKVSGAASGNATFCAAISASSSAPLPYAGTITAFTTGDTDSLAPWSLVLSLPLPAVGVVDGQICILDLAFEAYQEGGAVGTEYHDTEHVVLTLTADPPVIVPPTAPDTLQSVSQIPDSQPTGEGTVTDTTTGGAEQAIQTTEDASSTAPVPPGEGQQTEEIAPPSPNERESASTTVATVSDVLPELQSDSPTQ